MAMSDAMAAVRRPDLLARRAVAAAIPCGRRLAFATLPSVLQHHLRPAATPDIKERLGDTAYLDGVRGILALLVITAHQLQPFGRCPTWIFGGTRIAFFVIAGYCSSHRAQAAMAAGTPVGAVLGIGKSAYRKCLRLYLPVFATTLLIAGFVQLGAFENLRPWVDGHDRRGRYFVKGWGPNLPAQTASIWDQLRLWYHDSIAQTLVWQTDGYGYGDHHTIFPRYNSYLWTLKQEFGASMALYLVLVMCACMKPMARLAVLLAVSQYHDYGGRWEGMLFSWGAVVAQLDISFFAPWRKAAETARAAAAVDNTDVQPKNGYLPLPCQTPDLSEKSPVSTSMAVSSSSNSSDMSAATRTTDWLRTGASSVLWLALLLLAGWLAAFPSELEPYHPASWHWIFSWTPVWWTMRKWSLEGLGWALFIICMQTARSDSMLHRLLTHSLPRHAGRLFFGMLCTQHFVFSAGGFWLHHLGWQLLGGDWHASGAQFWVGWAFGWVINLVLCLWAADVWTRELFGRTNQLAGRIEQLMFLPTPPARPSIVRS